MSENVNGSSMLELQPVPTNRGTCQQCRFGAIVMTSGNIGLTCKRNPPIVFGGVHPVEVKTPTGPQVQLQWFTQGAWPNVGKDDWCGEYAIDPNAIRSGAKSVIEHASDKAS